MSEEEVEHEVEESKPAPKKRSREKPSAPRKKAIKPVTIVNDRFVCSYSGAITEKAIFVPGDLSVCFANFPCAFAYLDATIKDAEKLHAAKVAVCDAYEQNIETVQPAPDRGLLGVFGGDRSYEEWLGPLNFWNVLTSNSGTSVSEYRNLLKNGGKRGTKGDGKITLEAGLYVVNTKGNPRRVDAVDGAVEKGAKESLTPVRAFRKLDAFVAKSAKDNGPTFRIVDIGDVKGAWRGYGVVLSADSKVAPGDAIPVNKIATAMSGLNHYGPACVFVTKKTSIKI